MPQGEADEGDLTARVADTGAWDAVVVWQPEVVHTHPVPQALLGNLELGKSGAGRVGPNIEAAGHEGLITREVDDRANAPGRDELGAPDRFHCWFSGPASASGYSRHIMAEQVASTFRIEVG